MYFKYITVDSSISCTQLGYWIYYEILLRNFVILRNMNRQ